MDVILKGLVSGVVLAFLIGPVFFTIIQTSIERGFKSGILVATGVSLSDSVYIALTYLGLSQVIDEHGYQLYLAYTGGIVLLAFGFYYLFVKSRRMTHFNGGNVGERGPLRLIAKGFIINGLSPMVLIFWIGTVGVVTTEFGYTTRQDILLFFCTIVGTVYTTDIIKAKLADKLRDTLTPNIIRGMNLALGIAFVVFGGRLILYADNFQL